MRPIFIGGCDRSGTTLLGSLLGGTVGAITTPESQFKAKIFRELDWLGDPVGRLIAAALEMITAHDRFCSWTTKLPQLPSPEDNGPTTFRGLLEWVVTHYSQQHEGPAAPQVWIDHDPQNFRIFDDLVHHFPEARFVHIVRDGRAVAASLFPLDWGPNTVLKAAHFWQTNVEHSLNAEQQHADRVVRVGYEDLVREPQETLAQLCQQLDLHFSHKVAEGGEFAVPSYTQGQHELVGHPPDASRIDAWRDKLTPRQIELFESEAGTLLQQLGYRLTNDNPRTATCWERSHLALTELFQKQMKRRRYKRRVATQQSG